LRGFGRCATGSSQSFPEEAFGCAHIGCPRNPRLRFCCLQYIIRECENGLTQQEVLETITHLAFYASWPNAVTAIAVSKGVFERK